MNFPSYYCPSCNYKFRYTLESFEYLPSYEYCDCIKTKNNASCFNTDSKVLLLKDNNNIYYALNLLIKTSFIYNKTINDKRLVSLNTMFHENFLISQEFINQFPSLIHYL